MPVPRPDPAPIPVPSPDPHPAPSPKALLLAAVVLCAGCELDDLVRLPGSPQATPRPTPNPAAARFDGAWAGSFSGAADVPGGPQDIGGAVAFVADDGVVVVDQPSAGSGTIAADGRTTFAGSTSIGGLPVTCTFTGTLRTIGAMSPGTCRCSSLAGGATGTWTAARR
jgi:hypothetical protein